MNNIPLKLTYAIAVLAAAQSAHAQQGVEVYGLLDLNVGEVSHFNKDQSSALRVSSGGMNTSRLGFRGSEDLGDGLKAIYQLEMGIAADTGTADNPLFKRQANVGLEGRYGRLVVGRSFTSVYDFVIGYDPMGYAPFYSWGPSGNASGVSKYGMTTAFDNMIKYTGKIGNFSFAANYGAGEQSSSIADGAKGAVAANYASGPSSMVATYERVNGIVTAATGRRDVTTAYHLGVMYRSGPLKLQAVTRDYKLESGKAATPDVRARLYWAGASYLITPVVTLTGAVYYQDVKNVPSNLQADPVMYVARARYALSKRTDLYVTAAYAKAKNGQLVSLSRDDQGYGNNQRGLVAGIQHRF
jgi:predicted porin